MNNTVGKMVIWSLLAGGCAGDKSPREKCEDLVSVMCDRGVECIPGGSGMHDACVQAADQVISCSATKSVAPGYDHCIDVLHERSCQSLFPVDSESGEQMLVVPAECKSVLLTATATGEVTARTTVLPPGPVAGMIRGATAVAE
jgi:hypothetical protein